MRRTSASPICNATIRARMTVRRASGQNAARGMRIRAVAEPGRPTVALRLAAAPTLLPGAAGVCTTSSSPRARDSGKRIDRYESAEYRTVALWSKRPHTAAMRASIGAEAARASRRRICEQQARGRGCQWRGRAEMSGRRMSSARAQCGEGEWRRRKRCAHRSVIKLGADILHRRE